MKMISIKKPLSPADKVLIAYLLLTTALIPFSSGLNSIAFQKIALKAAIILGILTVAYADNKKSNSIISFIHLFYPLLLLGYFYNETAALNKIFFKDFLDPVFINIDQTVFGFQPPVLFSKTMPQKWFSELMFAGYFSYYFMTAGVNIAIYFRNSKHSHKAIFLTVTSFLIYYLIFIVLPVAGPQFYFDPPDSQIASSGFFANAVKTIQLYGEKPTGAFPSSHVGMTLIFLYLAFMYDKTLFFILLIPAIIILFATVYIKAHYAIDVAGGILTVPIILYISLKLYHSLK